MRTDRTGDVRQRVLFDDDLSRFLWITLCKGTQVCRDILMDRTNIGTGRCETVEERRFAGDLSARGLFEQSLIVFVRSRIIRKSSQTFHIDLRGRHICPDRIDKLRHALIAARLQDVSRHGDGINTGTVNFSDIIDIRTACKGQRKLSIKFTRDLCCQVNGKREQTASGHIGFLTGQESAGDVDRFGVCQFQPESDTGLLRQSLQPMEHRNRILPLQVLTIMQIRELNAVPAKSVQRFTYKFVSQQCRIALNVGIQLLFRDQMRSDTLDLIRRAAMQRGDGNVIGNMRRNRADIGFIDLLELILVSHCPVEAFLPGFIFGSVAQRVDEVIDLRQLDACQVITDAHVEDKAVRSAQIQFLRQKLDRPPAADIFRSSIGDRQFRGPLNIIAFVIGQNAGTGYAFRQFFPVHFLYGLQFKEARTGSIGGYQVSGQLCIRTGSRTEGCFDFPAKNRDRLPSAEADRFNAQQLTGFGVSFADTLYQFTK